MATKKNEVTEQPTNLVTVSEKHLVTLYRATVYMVERDAKNLVKLEAKLAKLASPLESDYEKLETRIANLARRITTHNDVLKTVKTTLTESESPPSEQSK